MEGFRATSKSLQRSSATLPLSIANNAVLANNSVLSEKLEDSYFSLDVESEWSVEYASPGAVSGGRPPDPED